MRRKTLAQTPPSLHGRVIRRAALPTAATKPIACPWDEAQVELVEAARFACGGGDGARLPNELFEILVHMMGPPLEKPDETIFYNVH